MIAKSRIKKGDNIIVITGKDKGKTSEVLFVYPKESKVLIKDVNVVKTHKKASQTSAGGIIEKELPVHISNIAFLDPKLSKPTKIGYKFEDGKKVRFAKLSGTILK